MIKHLKKLDWVLAASAISLVSFGLVSLYASGGAGGDEFLFKKQVLWLVMGFFLMVVISFFDYRILKNYRSPILVLYGFSLILLFGLLVFGANIRGTESWYRIGGITIEPVEFVKISIVLLFAKYFSMRHIEMYRFRHIITSGLYMLLPASLVFIQSEVGSVLILISTWIGVMIIAGIKIKHLAILIVAGAVLLSVGWNFAFQDYQKDRLISFINPGSDPRGSGYNILQSTIAVGSGGILGRGIGEGTQTQLGFLPEAQTDFIFAAITEELGLVGVFILLSCFAFFSRKVMDISRSSSNNFARLVVAGFSIMVLSQMSINIGMTLGLLPITGIPLPFVSYGGSSLISLFAMLGILQSIKIN